MTFWGEAEGLLGGQLGSLSEPWVSIHIEPPAYRPSCDLTFRIGQDGPALILAISAYPTLAATVLSSCCGAPLSRQGKRFACESCRNAFSAALSEIKFYLRDPVEKLEAQITEWIEFSLNPLEVALVAPHIAAWLYSFGALLQEEQERERTHSGHFLERDRETVATLSSLAEAYTGPLSVLLTGKRSDLGASESQF